MATTSKVLDSRTVRIGASVRTPASVADKGAVRIGASVRRA